MKLNALFPLIAFLSLAACQSQTLQETIRDQDRQLDYAQQTLRTLDARKADLEASIAELEDQYTYEQQRRKDAEQRFQALNATYQATQSEVEGLRARLEGTGVGVSKRGDILVLDLPTSLTFQSGSASLNAKGKKSLKKVAEILTGDYAERTFWVEGHTDSDQLQKSKEKWGTNLELSVHRALAVSNFLMNGLGLGPDQIRISGHGPTSPAQPNDNAKNKAANRRVEILVF